MSTVSLQMIVKDEFAAVAKTIDKAFGYFDEINITVSDKTTANKLKKIDYRGLGDHINIKWREWNDRFDDARNANYAMSTTDYTFWLDADDFFDFSVIPELVAMADENNIDAIFLPYNYAQDEEGNCVTRHWRERLVRNGKGFTWRGWVHETYISDEPYTSHKVDNEVVHLGGMDHVQESVDRNHKILEKAYEATKDPRYLHYLGMSYFTHKEYDKAISALDNYLEVGKSVEDVYRSLGIISESAYHLKHFEQALEYATKAATLKPEYPMAYWLLAQYEADQENWDEALEWVKVSLTKPDPDSLSVFDPSARGRALMIAAQADFMRGNYRQAYKWLAQVKNNATAKELEQTFREEAAAETFVELLPTLRKYFTSDAALWNALCQDMKYDVRLRQLRNIATEPKEWGEKSIVIFCGEGYEEWGPHTLDKGMGGSEEAVVYLSRELVKLGWDVTIFGEASGYDAFSRDEWLQIPTSHDIRLYSGGKFPAVHHRHWKEIDKRDKFNIFISWRSPQYLDFIDAKVKLCDLHDVMPEELVNDKPGTTYMVKSNYHRNLYPKLQDDKFKVIGNGIKKEQFHGTTKD